MEACESALKRETPDRKGKQGEKKEKDMKKVQLILIIKNKLFPHLPPRPLVGYHPPTSSS
jgi:hypothetical protein